MSLWSCAGRVTYEEKCFWPRSKWKLPALRRPPPGQRSLTRVRGLSFNRAVSAVPAQAAHWSPGTQSSSLDALSNPPLFPRSRQWGSERMHLLRAVHPASDWPSTGISASPLSTLPSCVWRIRMTVAKWGSLVKEPEATDTLTQDVGQWKEGQTVYPLSSPPGALIDALSPIDSGDLALPGSALPGSSRTGHGSRKVINGWLTHSCQVKLCGSDLGAQSA